MTTTDVRNKAIGSVFWKFSERILAQSASFIVSIILARILTPKDYSVVGIVTFFFSFADVLISGGFNTALVQKKDSDEKDYSAVLFVSILVSLLICGLLWFCAPTIALLYDLPLLKEVLRVMSLVLPVYALKSVWCAKVSSSLDFKKFFFATIIGTFISGILGILLAIKGFGPWALVAQQMCNTIIDTFVLIIVSPIHLTIRFSFGRLKALFSYSWKILVSSFVSVLYSNVTPLFIGLRFSNEDLAFYTKGQSFPSLLSSTVTSTLSSVLFPVMAKYQDDKDRILQYTRLFIRLTSFICFPIMLGFLVISGTFVELVLTEKWLPIVPYIHIFCVSMMFEMVHVGNCETIKALGRSDIYLRIEIVKKTLYFILIGLFLLLSDKPVVLAFSSIGCTLIALTVNSIPNRKLIGYRLGAQLEDLIPNLAISVAMCVPVYIIGRLSVSLLFSLVLQIFVGIVCYTLLCVVTSNKSFYYILDIVKSRRLQRKEMDEND